MSVDSTSDRMESSAAACARRRSMMNGYFSCILLIKQGLLKSAVGSTQHEQEHGHGYGLVGAGMAESYDILSCSCLRFPLPIFCFGVWRELINHVYIMSITFLLKIHNILSRYPSILCHVTKMVHKSHPTTTAPFHFHFHLFQFFQRSTNSHHTVAVEPLVHYR